jgi:nucleoside-diphosphate-sugar epimerase
MRVLLTGGSGFIGSHLLKALEREGHEGMVIGRRKPMKLPVGFTWISCDLSRERPPSEALEGVELIFHLAGLTKAWSPEEFFRGNYILTKNLIEGVKKYHPPVKCFLYLSSQAAAGPSYHEHPRKESDTPKPISYYGFSKLLAEGIVMGLPAGIPWTILRPSAVYGPGDRDFLLVFKLLKLRIALRLGGIISLIYIDDLIEAILKAYKSSNSLGEIFFIAHPESCEVRTFVEEATELLIRSKPVVYLPGKPLKLALLLKPILKKKNAALTEDKLRELFAKNWVCSTEKASTLLDFTAKTPLTTGLQKTISWYRREGLL